GDGMRGAHVTVVHTSTLPMTGDTFAADSALDNRGLLLVRPGVGTINGTLTTTSASIIRVQSDNSAGGATLTVANGFTNNGLIERSEERRVGKVGGTGFLTTVK